MAKLANAKDLKSFDRKVIWVQLPLPTSNKRSHHKEKKIMGYLHIENLYKYPHIFTFPRVYVLEKIHGTSAHIKYTNKEQSNELDKLSLFSGGIKHNTFVELFDKSHLLQRMKEIADQYSVSEVTFFGEAYGGKCQGMSETYGKNLKFIVFDVMLDGKWLTVPEAYELAIKTQLEFVWWTETNNTLELLNEFRDKESTQAIRNGCGQGKKSEGIVIRPTTEEVDKHGNRVICKHKNDDFRETKTPRVVDPEHLKVLETADAIANEWVTEMRLTHVLDKMPGTGIESTGLVIKAMIEDVKREAKGEVVWSKDVERKIGTATALMFKNRLKTSIKT